MKISFDPVIASRIKSAWGKLPADQQARITPLLMKGHQQAVTASQARVAPATDGSGQASRFTARRAHRVIPDAGHNLPQEAPEAFAAAVLGLIGV